MTVPDGWQPLTDQRGAVRGSARGWSPSDLDRCEHGRHSVDPCFFCPGGWSVGNNYLAPLRGFGERRGESVRIGTALDGTPITVVPVREREVATDEETS